MVGAWAGAVKNLYTTVCPGSLFLPAITDPTHVFVKLQCLSDIPIFSYSVHQKALGSMGNFGGELLVG